MLGSLFGIVGDTVKVVAAPIEIAADITRVVTKPIADVAETVVKEVKDVTRDITD